MSNTNETKTVTEEIFFDGKVLFDISKDDFANMDQPKLREYAEKMCLEYNEAYSNRNEKSASEIDDLIVQAVNTYTSVARNACFKELAASTDPMLEAVKQMTYKTIRICDKKEGGEIKVTVRSIEDTTKPIDLLKLHKFVKNGIGADDKWVYIVEQFNFLCTYRVAKELGLSEEAIKKVNSSYYMAAISKQIDLGKNPTSNTNMLKTLTKVVHAMVGENYKPLSKDVNYLNRVYAKADSRNALKVVCANHNYMRRYLMAVCHRIVTNTPYEVAYKELKNK